MRFSPGVACAVSAGIVMCGAIAPTPGSASPSPSIKHCSTSGLTFEWTHGSATYSVKVELLRANGVTCATARNVARHVAYDSLHNERAPARIDGLATKVDKPCAGCSPITTVTARSAHKMVTFQLAGGA